ncbi:energy transducer TonB [Acidisoma cellulosilytica]|uniref:Energy transducer TonB n=1 Tax=Acidisoma cellulosilyticum TaxID=2802395 RepID=A0A964E6C3_9PROT|nr:TonB family protein [Acidisoma cellulosilyticum]MCB8882873.1 energy transducer TonB [Acidisoma cellulosilyticum]
MAPNAPPFAWPADAEFLCDRPRTGLRRAALWGTCLGLVVAGHLAFFLELNHHPKTQGEVPLPPAVMIDLTPLPAPPAPSAPPTPAPAAKPQPAPQVAKTVPTPPPKVPTPVRPVTPLAPTPPAPTPPQPLPKVQTPPPPITPPVVQPPPPLDLPVAESDASLPMPPPPPPVAPQLPRKKLRVLHKAMSAPPPPATQVTQTPKTVAAPAPSTPSASDADTPAPARQSASPGLTKQDWQSRLLAHIAQYKSYPSDAQDNGWQGMSIVRFTFTRTGLVTSAVLVRSSGHADLDTAAIATLHRASPLPPPPDSVPGDPITLTLPLQFSLDQN